MDDGLSFFSNGGVWKREISLCVPTGVILRQVMIVHVDLKTHISKVKGEVLLVNGLDKE
jgi:hypothetical protein